MWLGEQSYISSTLDVELDSLLQYFMKRVDDLKVFSRQENQRWDTEAIYSEVRREMNRVKKDYLMTLSDDLKRGLSISAREDIKRAVEYQLANLDVLFWSRIESDYRMVVAQKKMTLDVILRGNLISLDLS